MINYFEYRRIRVELNRHLISWAKSGAFELAAHEVLCMTPNLVWAQIHIDRILKNVSDNEGKKYRYIVFKNNVDGDAQDAIQNATQIISEARKNEKIRANNALSILFLTKDRTRSSPYFLSANNSSVILPPSDELAFLPIPTDIVIYKDTLTDLEICSSKRRTFAVMSITPVTNKVISKLAEGVAKRERSLFGLGRFARIASFAYDFQLGDPKHYGPLKNWFNWEWDHRTGSE